MSTAPLRIHIDGAARGNPGPAAYAYVIDGAGPRVEAAATLGRATNNVAEYTALVRALERADQLGARRLDIKSDSELLVKQMNGQYRVKNPDLQELYRQARELCRRFESVAIEHVPRAANGRADELCNLALDGQKRPASPARRPAPVNTGPPAEALACLEAAAKAWAQGNPANPPPELVWQQLWDVLESQGLVRQRRPR